MENETAIQEALSRLIKDKTVLIIAHRMRTVAGADQVVVLSGGIVAEQDSPAELYARKGLYLERFFRKICPAVISMIVVPFCSLVLSVIIAHTVLGPIGWKIGTFISDIVYAGISGSFRVVFGAIFGFVYTLLRATMNCPCASTSII